MPGPNAMSDNDEWPGFDQAIEMLDSKDWDTSEGGYFMLLSRAEDYSDELLERMREEKNLRKRAQLIELLGEVDEASLIPILRDELQSGVEEVEAWALGALDNMGARGLDRAQQIADQFRKDRPKYQ